MTNQTLTLAAGFDRSLVWCRGDSVRHLLVDLTAANVARAEASRSPKLNFGLVLDCSGSMQGPRLRAAKQAMMGVVDRVADGTVLSVVSFSDDAQTHCNRIEVRPGNRAEIKQKIDSLTIRDFTNLSTGWLQGAELVALEMDARPAASHRVIVLSDGRANRGLTDPQSLAMYAGELRKRGLCTSTVGIGDDYEHTLLQVMADQGGGRMHDAATPSEIVEVLLGELQEMARVVAEDIEVEVSCPPEVEIRVLGGHPHDRSRGKVVCGLGALHSGANRPLVLKVICPEGSIGSQLAFSVQARYRAAGVAEEITTAPVACELTFATGQENINQPRDDTRSANIARVWQAHAIRRAAELNTEGEYGEASHYLERELRYFRRYCSGLEGARELLEELESTRVAAGRPWSPRVQKEVFCAAASRAKNETDHRSASRPRWSSYLTEFIDQR